MQTISFLIIGVGAAGIVALYAETVVIICRELGKAGKNA